MKIVSRPFQTLLKRILTLLDDPEIYHGAPIGLQLFGRRLEEEKIITIAEYLSEKVKVYTGQ